MPDDTALTGPSAYRWWHFDLNDPELASWCASTLDPIPAAALLQSETRPRCDPYKDGLILNLRGINMNDHQPSDQMVSVRMWVARDVIVTVRVRKVFAMDDIRQGIDADDAPRSPAAFLQRLIGFLTGRIQNEVMQIVELTEFYERDLEDKDTPTPKELPEARRRVIKLRRYLEPQQNALNRLATITGDLITPDAALELRELANRTTIAVEELAAQQERIIAVQDEHDLQVSQKQASHGYRLSVAAAVFLPLGFLTGLFGVNVAGMPGMKDPMAFTVLCVVMGFVCVILLIALKITRWL
ncbi:CorA family divalent cation transporter [Sulfitobacter aestuariivivens]|uniref:CorA family divalent cation transporter n=1 Tax=Sulfitobacter aestuariivivens TaxID=2766981 RepID=UPI0036191243